MRLFYVLLLVLILAGFSRTSAQPIYSTPPNEAMKVHVQFNLMTGQRNWEKQIRQEAKAFRFAGPNNMPDGLIDFASRTIRFEAISDAGSNPDAAFVALHDPADGATLVGCAMPCDIAIDPNRSYIVSAVSVGHIPHLRHLDPGYLDGDNPFTIYLGPDMLKQMSKAITCYDDYVAAGQLDQDATACMRFPPIMPPEATRSGHCKMMFDVSDTGWPQNIRTTSCSDDVFRLPSEQALRGWYYTPKTARGQAVTQTNVETTISFNLVDENGRRIEEDGRIKME